MAQNRKLRKFSGWDKLPNDMLRELLVRLGFFDIFTLASVCTSWSMFAREERQNFCLNKHQPFIIIISLYAKRACSFLNIFDRSSYKTLLPNIACKSVSGLSSGYIIMLEIERTWAINPLTKAEIPFPSVSGIFDNSGPASFRTVLVYSPQISDYIMIAASRGNNQIIMSRPGRKFWRIFTLPLTIFGVTDISFFQGKLYILNLACEIYQLSLFPFTALTHVPLKCSSFFANTPNLQLVASDDRLIIVDLYTGFRPLICGQVDFCKKEVVQVVNLGDEALFFSRIKSCLAKPGKWGGLSNCIYALNSECVCFALDGSVISVTEILKADAVRCHPYVWYIPPFSCNPHILST